MVCVSIDAKNSATDLSRSTNTGISSATTGRSASPISTVALCKSCCDIRVSVSALLVVKYSAVTSPSPAFANVRKARFNRADSPLVRPNFTLNASTPIPSLSSSSPNCPVALPAARVSCKLSARLSILRVSGNLMTAPESSSTACKSPVSVKPVSIRFDRPSMLLSVSCVTA